MALLILAAVIWIGIHIGIAGTTIRGRLAGPIGDNGFRGAFSIGSVAAIALLIVAYNRAPYVPLWVTPAWIGWLLVVVMLVAFMLFAASVMGRNPTAVGQDAALANEPRGIQRITRHPMLWSFVLWAAVHVIGNGDEASLVFFGAFLVTALAGMPSIDAKIAARNPEAWSRFAAATSIVPFGAIAAKRNRLALAELGWLPVAVGVVAWALMLGAHPHVIGVSPFPAG